MCAPVMSIVPESLHASFLNVLPRIEVHARISSRHIKCQQRRADFISEVVSLCWKWWVRLHQRGKSPAGFVSTLASLAARHVRSGRRLCGQLKPHDVLSERAQREHGFTVEKIPDFSTLTENPFSEALIDNTRSEVPDQVAFRCDFPVWLHTRTRRDRRMIADMATGERTGALARRFRLSAGRVSQLREEFRRDWQRFVGDLPLVNKPIAASACPHTRKEIHPCPRTNSAHHSHPKSTSMNSNARSS